MLKKNYRILLLLLISTCNLDGMDSKEMISANSNSVLIAKANREKWAAIPDLITYLKSIKTKKHKHQKLYLERLPKEIRNHCIKFCQWNVQERIDLLRFELPFVNEKAFKETIKEIDHNMRDEDGTTILHKIKKWDQSLGPKDEYFNKIRLLLEAGTLVDAQEYDTKITSQQTPLHVAAKNEDADLTNLLLTYGADHTIRDDRGKTPLQYAAENMDTKVAEVYSKHGIKLNDKEAKAASKDRSKTILYYYSHCK